MKRTIERKRVPGLGAALLAALMILSGLAASVTGAFAQGSTIRDAEIEALMRDYADPIFKAAGQAQGRVRVEILNNDTFNAFVLDGGHVFMHTGTLMQAKTPNEVIGVIAHETGHIVGAHVAQTMTRLAQEQTRSLLLKILGIGAAIATGKGEAVVAADEIQIRSFLALRRTQEGSADQAGLTFLTATHQSGQGMLSVFERFAQQELLSVDSQDVYLRTHPLSPDRLRQLRERVNASPYRDVKDSPQLQWRHDLMRAKLSGYIEPPQTVLSRYPESDHSQPARYARAMAKWRRGGAGALEASLAEIDSLIRERPDYAYFHEVKGDILRRAGQAQQAIGPYSIAYKLSGNNPLIGADYGGVLVASNNPAYLPQAEEILTRAVAVDLNPAAFRNLAQAYANEHKEPQSLAAHAQAEFMEGHLKDSKIFARRAQLGLPQGSPLWLKMDDIIKFKLGE